MHTTEPSTTDHPLLARLPVAAGAVFLRALPADDVDDFLAYRSDPERARYQGWQPMDRDAARVFLRDAASLRLLSRLGFLQTSSEDVVFRGAACTEVTLERCP